MAKYKALRFLSDTHTRTTSEKKENEIFSCSLIFLNESGKDEETFFG